MEEFRRSAEDVGPTGRNGFPYMSSGLVGDKCSGEEVCGLVHHMQQVQAIQIHSLYLHRVVEVEVFCADCKF